MGYDMVECREDRARDSCLELFNTTMDSLIRLPDSYEHQFDSVGNVRLLPSPDKKFRLITWGFRHPNDSFVFYGILQYADEDKEAVWLSDSAHQIGNNDTAIHETLSPERWYGAIYYQLEKVRYRKETYYLLLGWNGNTVKTDRKVLEVLHFDEAGDPVFGLPVFDMGGGNGYQNRVIWEYHNGASMALLIEDGVKKITFEHIQPADPRAKGIYTLYLPDGTYDYLEFKKGVWIKKEMLFDQR